MASDFYEELGVGRGATEKEIRAAYRALARKHHPDVNPDGDEAAERFKRINEAYQVLSDEKTRRDYDEFGPNWRHADQLRSAGAGGRGAGSPFSSFSGFSGFGGLEDLLSQAGFGGGSSGRGRRATGRQRLETTAEITLEEAYHGTQRVVSFYGSAPCTACRGSGRNGAAACAACRGYGAVERERRLEVAIPAGVNDGDRIRVRPDDATEVSLRVSVRPHREFERAAADLSVDVVVPYLDAVLGGEVEVPTMTGRVALTIPAGTRHGRLIRLAGKGMPRRRGDGGQPSGGDGFGDLVARVIVGLPEEVSEEEKGLFEQLKTIRDGVPQSAPRDGGAA